MTLATRREPSFDGANNAHHAGTHETSHYGARAGAAAAGHAGTRATGLTRVVSSVQIVGSLLAVPLGLASGYSIYRANFSPETTCQNLRSSIISMLDKSVDASTRRMLVRRDVQAFEDRCGSFDPDAHAAFKTLLAVPQVAAAGPKLRAAFPASETPRTEGIRKIETKAAAKAEAKAETKTEAKTDVKRDVKPEAKSEAKAEAKPEPKPQTKPESRPEPRAVAAAKTPAPPAAAPPTQPVQAQTVALTPEQAGHETVLSDTRWLSAVRQALVKHDPEHAETADAPGQAETKPARAESLVVGKASPAPNAAPVVLQPAWNVTPPPAEAPAQAAVQPSAEAAAAPQPPQMMGNHPVPPAAIPVSEHKDGEQSLVSTWISNIPFVGQVIAPGGN